MDQMRMYRRGISRRHVGIVYVYSYIQVYRGMDNRMEPTKMHNQLGKEHGKQNRLI